MFGFWVLLIDFVWREGWGCGCACMCVRERGREGERERESAVKHFPVVVLTDGSFLLIFRLTFYLTATRRDNGDPLTAAS